MPKYDAEAKARRRARREEARLRGYEKNPPRPRGQAMSEVQTGQPPQQAPAPVQRELPQIMPGGEVSMPLPRPAPVQDVSALPVPQPAPSPVASTMPGAVGVGAPGLALGGALAQKILPTGEVQMQPQVLPSTFPVAQPEGQVQYTPEEIQLIKARRAEAAGLGRPVDPAGGRGFIGPGGPPQGDNSWRMPVGSPSLMPFQGGVGGALGGAVQSNLGMAGLGAFVKPMEQVAPAPQEAQRFGSNGGDLGSARLALMNRFRR